MLEKPAHKPPEKRPISLGLRLTLIGFFIIWGASIAFALQLKILLTPGRYTGISDPSFDILIAALCVFIILLGIVLLWRGIREIEGLPGGRLSKSLTIAALINVGVLVLVLVVAGLIFSANRAFAVQDQPRLRDAPAPAYSVPAFPTPALPQPTPTYDPAAVYMAGSILDYFSGLRVGNIWISASKTDNTLNFIQVYTNRVTCSVKQDNSIATYAVDKSQQLIQGPIQVQNTNFYVVQDALVIQGVIGNNSTAYGTVYLNYVDPATKRSCFLGNFTWTASATSP